MAKNWLLWQHVAIKINENHFKLILIKFYEVIPKFYSKIIGGVEGSPETRELPLQEEVRFKQP